MERAGLPLPPVLVDFRPLGGRLVVCSQGPSDLERLGLGRAAPRPGDLIVAPLRDDPLSLFHLRPARDALAAEVLPRNGHVSKILHVIDLRCEVGVDAAQGFPPAPDGGVAAGVTAAIQLQVARDQLDVWVADREEGIEVVAAEGVSGSVLLLHVLL
jgi:hypothetical protein